MTYSFFFFQAEDSKRVLVRSSGVGNVYKGRTCAIKASAASNGCPDCNASTITANVSWHSCLCSTPDAADKEEILNTGARHVLTEKIEHTQNHK